MKSLYPYIHFISVRLVTFIMASANTQDASNGQKSDLTASLHQFMSKAYDYVICGGGTAGLVLAARLTEDPNINVAVLEAGKHKRDDQLVDTPAAFPQLVGNPEYAWKFTSQPQVRRPLQYRSLALY